ncbi:hypothetical protein JCM15786_08260 [Nautilia lithotrophica]
MENVKCKVKSVKKPVRMCVVCRNRFLQSELFRLQCRDKMLVKFTGIGRSFYVCKDCINNKKFVNYLSKICKVDKEKAKSYILHFPFYI